MTHIPLPKSAPPTKLAGWDRDLLHRMDWKRFQDLAVLMLDRAGYVAEVAWVKPDGGTVLSVRAKAGKSAVHTLVECAGWSDLHVEGNRVAEFYRAMRNDGALRGIFITPGSFDPNAVAFAAGKNVELIDGKSFVSTIHRMRPEEQEYFLSLAKAGGGESPTCPSCGQKMRLDRLQERRPDAESRAIVFKRRELVSDDVCCRSILILPGADVLFIKGVRTAELRVEGKAMGNIVCTERLTIAAGGTLTGMVAAKSIRLEEGGVLEAEARILNVEEISPVQPQPVQEIWRCSAAPKCRTTLAPRGKER
jgi:hypothetical protein